MFAFSDLVVGGREETEALDLMLQQEFKQWDMILDKLGAPPPSLDKKCNLWRKGYCGHHGLKTVYGTAKKCRSSPKCWITNLMTVMKEEKSAGCLSDCKDYICSVIDTIIKKYLGKSDMIKELHAIGCTANPSQN